MRHALLVTVRLHEGRYHGCDHRKAVEWPPAPARLFQALVAGAARGATVPAETRAALDRLETLPPPVIAAPRDTPGQAFSNYVPNNDLDAELSGGTRRYEEAVALTRVGKRMQPILFDARMPILYCWHGWPTGADDEQASALRAAAHRLYQLGRGVDMAWAEAEILDEEEAERRLSVHGGIVYRPSNGGGAGLDLPCPGSGLRRSLETRFEGMRTRFRAGGAERKKVRLFVQPPKPRLANVTYDARPRRFVFEVCAGGPGARFSGRSLHETARFVSASRDLAAERLRVAIPNLTEQVDRYLVGRNADDEDKKSRVRLVPIPSIGHEHVDMAIRRLAVYVPQTGPLASDDVAWAFSQVAAHDADGVIRWELQRVDDDRMVRRFEQNGRRWSSVTPLALPTARRRRIDPNRRTNDLKGGGERAREEARAVAAVHHALRHGEVRVPVVDVRVQREPFDRNGARAEDFAPGTRFASRALWHAAVTFAEPVAGPLLLGDGRFIGLGLMRPDDPMRGVLAFTITGGLVGSADPEIVARAARRAMMARVQRRLPRGATLPAYVSGHDPDGSPVGDGGAHRHVAVVADLPRGRILYLAPTRLQRGGVRWSEIDANHRQAERALEGMDDLRAGAAGRLTLAPAVVDVERDPLFAPARIWESVTPYRVTRHYRRFGNDDALKADLGSELDRRGWPRPAVIDVLAARHGPRGGLSGRVRLVFRTAQAGPLLMGRTVHKGGGLFAGR